MAELARTLLGGPSLDAALPVAAERIATALELPSAALQRGEAPDHPGRLALPLSTTESRLGTLVVPAGIDPENLARLEERLVPGLEALLAAAIDREALLRATVETEALRRSDEIKTALLRTVSHDLRTPITAIRAAAEALTLSDHRRRRIGRTCATRSSTTRTGSPALVDNLLDLSRLRTGTAEPSTDWTSIEEVDRGGDQRPRHRSGPLPALDRREPPIHPGRRGPARAGLRQPALQRGPLLGRRAGLGTRPRGLGQGGDPGRGSRAGHPRTRPGADLRGLLPRARTSPPIPVRGSGWRSSRGSSRRTAASVSVESLPGQGTTFVVEFPAAAERHGRRAARSRVARRRRPAR